MRAVVQRVTRAAVDVVADGERRPAARIGSGLLVLVGVTHDDTADTARALARKVHGLRILRGERGVGDPPDPGEPAPAVLIVSQFTLYGDARKGRRPTWTAAAPGPMAEPLVDAVADELRKLGTDVRTGIFGADMRVDSENDGPVTLLLEF